MRRPLWILSLVSALCAAAFIVIGVARADSPLQMAAVGALGTAWAVVPYVLARSWDAISR